MPSLDDLTAIAEKYLCAEQVERIEKGYYMAQKAHEGQFRSSGEPYVTHPLSVAIILAGYYMEADVIIAALLHDTIEDTKVTKDDIVREFSQEIADLVDGVSKLTQIRFSSKEEAKAENFQKMILAMTKDIRVIVIKLVDRVHNMRTIGALRVDKKKRIANETLDVYIPIAGILSIDVIKKELEELCFEAVHKLRCERLRLALEQKRKEQNSMINSIQTRINKELEDRNIDADVLLNNPTSWEVYEQMKQPEKNFHSITSTLHFRIITENKLECYEVLGILHSMYNPNPGRFRDQIAIPRSNGFQALISRMILPGSKYNLQVEIMTQDMSIMADYGITSYWLYDAGMSDMPLAIGTHKRAQLWLDNLSAIQEFSKNSQEFTQTVKSGLIHTGEIYVFTRKGEIVELPRGATPVDFAYKLHTALGNTCVACKIDDKWASLSEQLKTGQRIEIFSSEDSSPNLSWQEFVVTAKAKSAIKDYEKRITKEQVLNLGNRLLENALQSVDLSVEDFIQIYENKISKEYEGINLEELLYRIGSNKVLAFNVVETYKNAVSKKNIDLARSTMPMLLKNAEGVIIAYAKCCQPIPGDNILGHANFGGIIVHRSSCDGLITLKDDKSKCMNLIWSDLTKDGQKEDFCVRLELETSTDIEPIADIARIILDLDSKVYGFNSQNHSNIKVLDFYIEVKNRNHLAKIMRKIKQNKKVSKINRI